MNENNIEYYKNELKNIDDNIDDIVENLKFMLIHNDIKDINLLNIHYELYDLLLKKDRLKNIIFNLKY